MDGVPANERKLVHVGPHMLRNSCEHGVETNSPLFDNWNCGYKGVSITFWQKILAEVGK